MQRFTFDTGPETATLTQANSGSSAAPTIGAGSSATFLAAAAKSGPFGARFTSTGAGSSLIRYATEGASNLQVISWFSRFSSLTPTATTTIMSVRYASGVVLRVQLQPSGIIQVGDVGGPVYTNVGAASNFSASTWYRFELVLNGGSTSAGAYTLRIYNAAGNQVGSTAQATNANMSANQITGWDIGIVSAPGSALSLDVDELQQETGRTTEIGAYVPSANAAPIVSASSPNTTTTPNSSVTLNGTATDTDGTIASNAWDFVSLPVGVTAPTLTGGNTNQATFTPTTAGLYVARYTATDNSSGSSSATLNIYVGGTVAQVIGVTSNTGLWTVTPSTSNVPTVLSDNDPNTYIESPASPTTAAAERLRLGPLQPLTTFSLLLGMPAVNGTGSLAFTVSLYEGSTQRKQWSGVAAAGADVTLSLNPTEIATITTSGWNTLDVEVSVLGA